MCLVKCLRVHLFPRRKGGHWGHRDHKPAWLGFYLFFAKTSGYCLHEGKVELRVLGLGGRSLIQVAEPCRSLGEHPSMTLAVRDGKYPSEISQEWFLWTGRHCQSSTCPHKHTWPQHLELGTVGSGNQWQTWH